MRQFVQFTRIPKENRGVKIAYAFLSDEGSNMPSLKEISELDERYRMIERGTEFIRLAEMAGKKTSRSMAIHLLDLAHSSFEQAFASTKPH